MFVKNLATISREKSKDKMNVNYKDLAEVVNSDDVLQFLQGTCKKNCKTSKADVIPVHLYINFRVTFKIIRATFCFPYPQLKILSSYHF